MPQLRSVKATQAQDYIKQLGYKLHRIQGSHYIFSHPETRKIVVIPFHNTTLKIGTLLSIVKQAGGDKQGLIESLNK